MTCAPKSDTPAPAYDTELSRYSGDWWDPNPVADKATLEAAAPAMLAALKFAEAEWCRRVGSFADNDRYRPEWIDRIRAAIALAEGRG